MVVKMRCPICGNEEFFYVPNPMMTGNRNVYTIIQAGGSLATANRYVCTKCGYLVEKFEGAEFQKIANKIGR